MDRKIKNIVFDLGGVLIDWDPLYVFENYFESKEKLNFFMSEICNDDWNAEQDSGKSIVDGTRDLITKYPKWEGAIRDYYGRWTDMLKGEIEPTVNILESIKKSNQYRVLSLTNWEASLFQIALVRYGFLSWFEGIVVSGIEKVCKPNPKIYKILLNRYQLIPEETLFIDDRKQNVEAAKSLKIQTIHYSSPEQLKKTLLKSGIL